MSMTQVGQWKSTSPLLEVPSVCSWTQLCLVLDQTVEALSLSLLRRQVNLSSKQQNRLLGKDGEEKVVAVVEGGRRRSNAAKNLRMLKRDSCCLPPTDWCPVTLGGVELTTVQTFYLQSDIGRRQIP